MSIPATVSPLPSLDTAAFRRQVAGLVDPEQRQGPAEAASVKETAKDFCLALCELFGTRAELDRLTELNRRYRERFGFPFVVALRLHATLASVFDSFEQRLQSSPEQELEAALGQVFEVMRGRLAVCLQENPSHNPALSPV